MKTLVVIPARLASQRLAEKLLLKLHNKEIILWVAQTVKKTGYDYIVATDDDRLGDILKKANVPFLMTSDTHASGTSRLTEVSELMPEFEHYCMVQGDEPFLKSNDIKNFIEKALKKRSPYVQAVSKFIDGEKPGDISNVKTVLSKKNKIIYASRSIIPFYTSVDNNLEKFLQISGLYLFSKKFLYNYKTLPPCDLELIEKIEQLRCLYNEINIDTVLVSHGMHSIDTYEDYLRLKNGSYVKNGELLLK